MLLLHHAWLILACLNFFAEAKDPKCTQGVQYKFQPLVDYPPARDFCKANFPPKVARAVGERAPSTTPAVAAANSKPTLLSSLSVQPKSVGSTFCSCLTSTQTKTTSKSSTTSSTRSSSTTSRPSSSSTSSSPPPAATACNSAQSAYCTSQKQNTCLCSLDTDGVTPVCSNGGICPQTMYPNPLGPCKKDQDCLVFYPGSAYTRCVYDVGFNNCSPTYCATEIGCNQNYGKVKRGLEDVFDGLKMSKRGSRRDLSEMRAEGVVRRMAEEQD